MKMFLLVTLTSLLSVAQVQENKPLVEGENAEKIYEALNVEEVIINPLALGSTIYEKSVGGLICRKFLIVYPQASPIFKCRLRK